MTRKYVHTVRDRKGNPRHYFRRKHAPRTRLPGEPGSIEFERAYLKALEGVENAPPPEPAEITVARVVDEWEKSKFRRLNAKTIQSYRSNYRSWVDVWGAAAIADIETRDIDTALDDKKATPSAANNLLRRLRQIFDFAVRRKYIAENPALEAVPFKIKGGGYHSWTDAEIAAYEARWPVGSKQRLYFALLLFTGQRLSDVVRMTWGAIDGGMIEVVQEKTETRLWVPLHSELRAILEVTPKKAATILVTDYGRPFSPKSMPLTMREWANAAGLPHCSSHGLRKAAARRLAEAECTSDQIKAITGHRSLSEVERYTRGVDQKKQASAAILKMESRRKT